MTNRSLFQDQQGQALPEVPEEADRPAREGQEEEGGDVQRPSGHEEGRKVDTLCPLSPLAVLSPFRSINHFELNFGSLPFWFSMNTGRPYGSWTWVWLTFGMFLNQLGQ